MATIIPSEVCESSHAREEEERSCWTFSCPWPARKAACMTATALEALTAQHKPHKAALGEPNALTAQGNVSVNS